VTRPARHPYALGLGAALAIVAGLALGLQRISARTHRAEGTAERWLSDVGDTARRGVRSDARRRVAAAGPGVDIGTLLPAVGTGGKRAFADLEVGKRSATGDEARVPYRLHQLSRQGEDPVVAGSVVLRRQRSGSWRVTGLDGRRAAEKVPSEGGRQPSRASPWVWTGGLAAALALTAAARSSSPARAEPKSCPLPLAERLPNPASRYSLHDVLPHDP